MKYAVKLSDGEYSGVVYDNSSPEIIAYHAQYGERLEAVDGLENVGSDDAPVWQPIATPLSAIRANAKAMMIDWIDRLTEQLRAGIPRDEIASWPTKAAEARAFLATGTPAPILQVEADLVGLSLTEVAETIAARATLYETVVGAVAGIRRNTAAAIDGATDAAGVEAVLEGAKTTAKAKAVGLGLVVDD
ncbi:hypothetical protein SAMN05444339_10279 [Loktanella atrilutea]|uniref:Uncharacterized protein n=1 Tax=Loktanella atrilutea TaxID=366533 RepID=A0A1M4WDN3_LOKAT|nr:hypothetical protein [Loktanella atrilutea]SHE79336.1 hypothetical protein SAMN05444339_10279 [Loktanella atrilutea]